MWNFMLNWGQIVDMKKINPGFIDPSPIERFDIGRFDIGLRSGEPEPHPNYEIDHFDFF